MEGTYRSIYKKNVQRDGCLLSNLRFTVGYTNLPPKRRRLSSSLLQSSQFSIISRPDLENGIPTGNTLETLVGKSLADAFKINTINQTGRIASESALKKRLCIYQPHTLFILFFCDESRGPKRSD